jgi:hypothetical protein
MIRFFARGTALVETALSVGVSLLLVLGAAQMALIGYTQISADGAAFIAAHTVAQNPSANGVNAATQVFTNTESGDYSTPSPGPELDPVLVQKNVAGFSLIPGVASSYNIAGKDLEYAPANVSATPAPFTFSVTAYLYNACNATNCNNLPSNSQIYLAQSVQAGNGNGANGQFAEWRCHQRYFAKLVRDFPNSYPTYSGNNGYNAYVKGTQLDLWKNGTDENNVYGWDTGNHKCT